MTLLAGTAMAFGWVSSANADNYLDKRGHLDKRWGPWVEMGGQFGDGRSIGATNLFAPVWQNPGSLLFVDLRGSFDDRSAVEGNFGFGFRHMLDSGWNLGAYGYLDVRRSSYGNTFHQATFGVEALGETFDFRANAYLPFGDREKRVTAGTTSSSTPIGGSTAVLTGTNLAIQTLMSTTLSTNYLIERAMSGFDAEVGMRLPIFPEHMKLDLRAFAGGYHFHGSGVADISGPRARLELVSRDFAGLPGVRLTGGLTWQDDKVRGNQLIASVGLRVPLHAPASGGKSLSYMEERMMDAVVRDVDIVTNDRAETHVSTGNTIRSEAAINTWNDEVVASVTQVDASVGGAAVQGHLNTLQAAAGADGSVVILNGDLTYAPGLNVNGRQTLLGGGTTLRVRGATSGVEVDYIVAGDAGSLTGNGTTASGASFTGLVNLGNSSVVGGLELTQTRASVWNAVINANDVSGAVAFNNTVYGSNVDFSHGILFDTTTGARAFGNHVTTASPNSYGIVAGFNATSTRIENNDITTMGVNSTPVLSNSVPRQSFPVTS